MFLGMGTVFVVLLALLAMMILGGRVAKRFIKQDDFGKAPPPHPPADGRIPPPSDNRIPAIAIAAAIRRLRRQGERS